MIVDVNVYIAQWPFRHLSSADPRRLVEKLRSQDVAQAWTGSFEALLHKDLAAVNARLAAVCREHGDGLLVPFGSVNPTLPDWEEDLRRCREEHGMRGVRLYPNYHGYSLEDPRFARLLELAEAGNLDVQLAVKMEDERTQHPRLRVRAVDVEPLVERMAEVPQLRLVLLNSLRDLHGVAIDRLVAAGQVYFDLAMLEGVGGVGRLVDQIGHERIVFGSHYPLFYFEAASLKLRESQLGGVQAKAILSENATRLLTPPS